MSDLKPDFIPAMNYGQYINIILYKDIYSENKITGSRHSKKSHYFNFIGIIVSQPEEFQ